MIGQQIAFVLLAIATLGGGLFSVMAKRTFHSAMGLGLVLVGVAGLFISMGSAFVGVVQVLVYVGGVLTLFVFAVMFVAGDEEDDEVIA